MGPEDGAFAIPPVYFEYLSGAAMTTEAILSIVEERSIQNLGYRAAVLLDEEKFEEWLKLFAEESEYELRAYSPEIGRWMTWWKSDRASLTKQLKEVNQHVRDPARRRRVVGAPIVELNGDRAQAVSSFAVYRTSPDGCSSLYIVGHYEDSFIKRSGTWFYKLRTVITDTRVLESFTHLPI